MSFSVRFPNPAKQQIEKYDLGPRWTAALVSLITRKCTDKPTWRLAKRIVAPVPCVVMHFDFQGPFSLPARVSVWVNDTKEEGVRIVEEVKIAERHIGDYDPVPSS